MSRKLASLFGGEFFIEMFWWGFNAECHWPRSYRTNSSGGSWIS